MTTATPSLWQRFVAWVESKKLSSHINAGTIVAAVGLYSIPEVHEVVGPLLSAHPGFAKIALAVYAVWLKYSNPATNNYKPFDPPNGELPMQFPNTQKMAAFLILTSLVVLTGCPRPGAISAPTAASIQQKAAAALDDISSGVLAFQASEQQLFTAGSIPAQTHEEIEGALGLVSKDGAALTVAIQNGESAATVSALAASIQADLSGALTTGVLGVKDAQTKTTLQAYISTIGTAVQVIVEIYNSVQPTAVQ